MSIGLNGQNLIFLISQPRAGSTLLQRMLENHPAIHTTAEPWTMLHAVYGLRQTGHEAEYNAQSAWLAVHDFIQQLPNQRTSYIESLRLMQTHLYNAALEGTESSHFLDKTPRYYHIIPELYEIFPDATFIFLLRNPLAVACSVMDTWIKGKWFKCHKYRADLLDAPHRLVEGIQLLGDRSLVVNYEHLLLNPDDVLKRITEHLNLAFSTNLVRYNAPQNLGQQADAPFVASPQQTALNVSAPSPTLETSAQATGFGYKDQKAVFLQGKPDKANLNKWVHHLNHPQQWRLLNDYYQALGDDTIRVMGTDPAEVKALLDEHRPSPLKQALTVSLDWAAKKPGERNTIPYEDYGIKVVRFFQRQGLWGGLSRAIEKAFRFDGVSPPSSTNTSSVKPEKI